MDGCSVTHDIAAFPFDTLPAPSFRPESGRRIVRLGAVVACASMLVPILSGLVALRLYSVAANPNADGWVAAVSVLPSLAIFIGGVLLIARGRQLQALPALDLLRQDRRTPVLFLRSFDDDDLVDPTPRMVPFGDFFPRRYEETLAAALRPVGPMVSIGRPGETLALLGGGRLFVPDHAWRVAVDYLRHHAAAVVLMVGRTDGIWWEIASCLKRVPLPRLLFFFPYVEEAGKRRSVWQRLIFFHPAELPLWGKPYWRMERERQARYALFRERVGPALSRALPETLGNALFIDFTGADTPRALTTVRPWWWPITILSPSMRHMIMNPVRTLQPFVDKLQGLRPSE